MAATMAPAEAAPMPQTEEPDFLSLSKLRTQLSDYETIKRNERDEAEEARRYYHGDQIAAHILKVLIERKQPPVVYNLIRRKVDGTVGLIERLRQDPKAFPRTPKHQQGADVATAVLNDVLETQQWKSLTPIVAKDGAVEPLAGIELSIDAGDRGDPDIGIHYLEPDTVFYDPRSSREDFSDAGFIGVAKWVALDQAQDMFPDHAEALKDAVSGGAAFDQLQDTDRARKIGWVNTSAKNIRLVEHWYKRHGKWMYQFYCGNLDLARGVSPFLDEKGDTFCRFILFSANVDHENDRYAITRDLRPIQDEINHRRSKALHALNTIRVYVEGIGLDPEIIENIRAEINKPDGVPQIPPGATVTEKSNADQVAGNLQMLAEAKAMIETFGPNPSLVGSAPASASGRALQLMQQAGISELGPYILGYRDWKMRVYRAVWNTVQRQWTRERWIRVTDDDGLAQFLGVNQLSFDPQTGQPTIVNALGSLDVDIIIDEGPDHVTLMEDTLDALMQLAPGMAQAGKPIPPEIIIELASLPQATKQKLLGYIQQASQPNPAAQAAQQLQLQGAAAKVDETRARADKLRADAGQAQADGQRANADAAETMARTRRHHADANDQEIDTALKFLAPQPMPFDSSEAPYAQGQPTMPGLAPQGAPMAPPAPGAPF